MFYKKNDLKLVSNFTFYSKFKQKITSKFKPGFVLISLSYILFLIIDFAYAPIIDNSEHYVSAAIVHYE